MCLISVKLLQIVIAGANPIQIAKGIENTAKVLVSELRSMSKEVRHYLGSYSLFSVLSEEGIGNANATTLVLYQVEDSELADVAAVSAGNNYDIGNMIAEAMRKVGRNGVVTLEEGTSAVSTSYVVEGMQFDRGYISPYFVTDSEKMVAEYENCKVNVST